MNELSEKWYNQHLAKEKSVIGREIRRQLVEFLVPMDNLTFYLASDYRDKVENETVDVRIRRRMHNQAEKIRENMAMLPGLFAKISNFNV